MYTISEAAELLGVTVLTLRRWDKGSKLKPSIRTPSGHRRYTLEDLSQIKPIELSNKLIVTYCRVPTPSLKSELNSQIKRVGTYCAAKGYSFKMLHDIGSGVNYSRPGFRELIHLVLSNQVEKIVVEHKDLLVGIGFEILEQVCRFHNVAIEIVDQTPYEWHQEEIADNIVSVIMQLNEKLKGSKFYQGRKSIQNLKKLFAN